MHGSAKKACTSEVVGNAERILFLRECRAKTACTLGILGYYLVGYFGLNRFPFETYHDVPSVPFFDDLPIIPWTIVVYNSVFILGALGIWLLPDRERIRLYFVSVVLAYTVNYLFFAFLPTHIDRAPVPQEGSMWLWAVRLTRSIDGPYTCFPSLHITNCTVAVIGLWGSRYGWWFLAWTVAIALSTLTTDQHLFLDLPAGAAVACVGAVLARRILRAIERRRAAGPLPGGPGLTDPGLAGPGSDASRAGGGSEPGLPR